MVAARERVAIAIDHLTQALVDTTQVVDRRHDGVTTLDTAINVARAARAKLDIIIKRTP